MMTLWHLKMLLLWILANCLLPWYAIFRNKKVLEPNSERYLEKYKPFVRNDIHLWSYFACIFTHFFFIPRYCMCQGMLIYLIITTKIILLGANAENLSESRKNIIVINVCFAMRVSGFFFGAV